MAALTRSLTRLGLPSDLGGVFVNVVLRLLILIFTVDYGDQFLGTHNVRDIMDTANDMLFGIVGATVFILVYKGTEWYQRKRALPKRARARRS